MHRWLLLLTLILPVSLGSAHAERWYKLYDQAKDDIDNQRWESAIAKLQQALEQKNESGASVRGEGTKRVAYFPYFLIGKAYYHLGRYDQAAKFLNRETQGNLPGRIATEIALYRNYLHAIDENRKLQGEFDRLVERARVLRVREAFVESADVLRGARVLSPAEFERRNLGRTLAEVLDLEKRRVEEKVRRENESRFLTLVREAFQREKQGRLRDAGQLLLEADRIFSGRAEVSALSKRVGDRQRRYAQLKQAALADHVDGKLPEALRALNQARDADPERFSSDKLAPLAASLSRQIAIEKDLRARAKTVAAAEARLDRVPGTRNQTPVATTRRDSVRVASVPEPGAVRRAVLAAYQGPPEEAVRMLEELKSANSRTRNPELESSIGIAYARLSFLTVSHSESERFREKAAQHFKLTRALDPGYNLNPRLVAPQILELFQASK